MYDPNNATLSIDSQNLTAQCTRIVVYLRASILNLIVSLPQPNRRAHPRVRRVEDLVAAKSVDHLFRRKTATSPSLKCVTVPSVDLYFVRSSSFKRPQMSNEREILDPTIRPLNAETETMATD